MGLFFKKWSFVIHVKSYEYMKEIWHIYVQKCFKDFKIIFLANLRYFIRVKGHNILPTRHITN